mgnify:CR=1 FL=1
MTNNKKIIYRMINEALGVPEGILDASEELYDQILSKIHKLKKDKKDSSQETEIKLKSVYIISDYILEKIRLKIKIESRPEESDLTLVSMAVGHVSEMDWVKFKLKNLDDLITTFDDEDIVVELDGDDFLLTDNVLSKVSNFYKDKNIWITNGSFMYTNGVQGFSSEVNPDTVRKDAFTFSHLRTWKSFLWKAIPKDCFVDENGELVVTNPPSVKLSLDEEESPQFAGE